MQEARVEDRPALSEPRNFASNTRFRDAAGAAAAGEADAIFVLRLAKA